MQKTSRHLHAMALWLQGRTLLLTVCNFHHGKHAQHFSSLQHLFRRVNLTPERYTFQFFDTPNICYVRVTAAQLCKAFVCVGCSHNSLTNREASRNREFAQVDRQAIVQAELALRWWHKHNNYHQYIPITIEHSIPPHRLEAREATYIQQLQPRPNHLYIHKHMKGAVTHFHRQRQQHHHTVFLSIWSKIVGNTCRPDYDPSPRTTRSNHSKQCGTRWWASPPTPDADSTPPDVSSEAQQAKLRFSRYSRCPVP